LFLNISLLSDNAETHPKKGYWWQYDHIHGKTGLQFALVVLHEFALIDISILFGDFNLFPATWDLLG
jgi:hypothetical protein